MIDDADRTAPGASFHHLSSRMVCFREMETFVPLFEDPATAFERSVLSCQLTTEKGLRSSHLRSAHTIVRFRTRAAREFISNYLTALPSANHICGWLWIARRVNTSQKMEGLILVHFLHELYGASCCVRLPPNLNVVCDQLFLLKWEQL
jgi:hypothetical protein